MKAHAYDSDRFVHWLEKRGAIGVIPSRKIAKHPRNIDWPIYKERHLVENLFLKFRACLKNQKAPSFAKRKPLHASEIGKYCLQFSLWN